MEPPQHLVLQITYTEPGFKGNSATNVTKSAKVETGAEVQVPRSSNKASSSRLIPAPANTSNASANKQG